MKIGNGSVAQMRRDARAKDYWCVAIDEIIRLLREKRFGRRKLKHLSSRECKWRNPEKARRTRAELLLLPDRCYVLLQKFDNDILAAVRATSEPTWIHQVRVQLADPLLFEKVAEFVMAHVEAVTV